MTVALSEWPGHMPLVIGNGGLTTAPGSGRRRGAGSEIVFIEDAPRKNKALREGEVDFVWQTVDEMPINMGGFKAGQRRRARLPADRLVARRRRLRGLAEVQKVEDILGRKSAMMMFSPDHTVFEFMITNSRLTPEQVARSRKDTSFSMDDFTYGRVLFTRARSTSPACGSRT